MSNKEPGYVYILTNPSFREDWVKIMVELFFHKVLLDSFMVLSVFIQREDVR